MHKRPAAEQAAGLGFHVFARGDVRDFVQVHERSRARPEIGSSSMAATGRAGARQIRGALYRADRADIPADSTALIVPTKYF